MTKSRLLALPLSLALALAGASAVVAQEEEAPAPEDPNAVAQYVYGWLQWWMETYDLDPEEVQAEYESEVENLSEEDAEDLLELYGASQLSQEAFDNLGDGDFNPFASGDDMDEEESDEEESDEEESDEEESDEEESE